MPHRPYRLRVLALPLAAVLVLAGDGAALGQTSAPETGADVVAAAVAPGTVLFEERFERPAGLITNAFATWNPDHKDATVDPSWGLLQGSLFAVASAGWTGEPDDESPDARSLSSTGSARLRLYAKQPGIGDARMSMRVLPVGMVSSSRMPARAIDGIHLWLRAQSDKELYAVSVLRRNGVVVVKKKCPGGTSNGGTYYALSGYVPDRALPFGQISTVAAEAVNVDGGVRLRLWQNDELVIDVVDNGVGCEPFTAPGYVGIRGDNTEFYFDDVVVTASAPETAQTAVAGGAAEAETGETPETGGTADPETGETDETDESPEDGETAGTGETDETPEPSGTGDEAGVGEPSQEDDEPAPEQSETTDEPRKGRSRGRGVPWLPDTDVPSVPLAG